MTGDSGKGKLGKIYNYYKCFTKKRNKEKCDKKSISKEYIEDIVFTATQNFFMQIDLKALAKKITEIYNKSIEENHELKALEKELADINKKLKNLLSAIENGIFNDTTNQRMKEFEISKNELEEKIAQTSAQSIQPFNEKQIYTYLLSFKDIDKNNEKAKQRLIDMSINKVVLFDDHVDIYFNASYDKKTHLKLKEMPEDGELFDSYVNKKQPETAKKFGLLALGGRSKSQFEPFAKNETINHGKEEIETEINKTATANENVETKIKKGGRPKAKNKTSPPTIQKLSNHIKFIDYIPIHEIITYRHLFAYGFYVE